VAKKKSLSPTGLRNQDYEPVESQYIDYFILTPYDCLVPLPITGKLLQELTARNYTSMPQYVFC